MKISKEELVKLSLLCNGCIVTRYSDDNYPLGVFHSDNIWLDEDSDLITLPNEVECIYKVMSEREYNNSVLAESLIKADFEKWYGDCDGTMLMIGIKG